MAPRPTSDRLHHGRYNREDEIMVSYCNPSDDDYKIIDSGGNDSPIQVEKLRLSLRDNPKLLQLLENRLKYLESFVSLEFDATCQHAAVLASRKAKHGNRYLNDVGPCYAHVTLKEGHDLNGRNFRAPNGDRFDLLVPLYLSERHANSCGIFLHDSFSTLAGVRTSTSGVWNDLWIADTLAHLMTQAILDFSKGSVSEPGIQFVVDCLRLLVHCCRETVKFPRLVPLLQSSVSNFIQHPHQRTRVKIPDLGDLMQCFGALALVDKDAAVMSKDLVSAIVVEAMRRQARWVGKKLIEGGLHPERTFKGYRLVPHRYRWGEQCQITLWGEETEAEMLTRHVRSMPKQELIDLWWSTQQVSWRVMLYSLTFSKTFTEDQTWDTMQAKYEPVLGAVYTEDIDRIKSAKVEIESISNLHDCVKYLVNLTGHQSFLKSADSVTLHELCVWAIENREGYVMGTSPDMKISTAKNSSKKRSRN